MPCLVKLNYKTTPNFVTVSKIFKDCLVLSSQTTKLHHISRGCQKIEGKTSCLVKPNYKTTPYFEWVTKISRCLVLLSQTTKLLLILRGCQKFEGKTSCLVKPNYKTTPYLVTVSKQLSENGLSCQSKLQNYT